MTTVARTLVDLAAALAADDLARACHEAGIRHHMIPSQVEAVLERRPSSAGARKLRAILRGDERVTLSALERRFLRLSGRPACRFRRRTGSWMGAAWTAAGRSGA